MKIFCILIAIIFFLSSCQNNSENKKESDSKYCFSQDQLFEGQTKNTDNELVNFQVKITSKDSVTIISYQDNYDFLTESHGNIIKINDSIFYLKTTTIFSTYFMEIPIPVSGFIDTIDSDFDTLSLLNKYKSMKLIYSDNSQEIFPIKDKYIVLPVDKKKFNSKYKTLKMDIGYINPINQENIIFRTLFGSTIAFTGNPVYSNFYVIIKNDILKSISCFWPLYCHYELNLDLRKKKSIN